MADPLADYRWLVSGEATQWLEWAVRDNRATLTATAALRRHISAERTHLILEQVHLRQRCGAKFSLASKMFFTPLGLEQATDEFVAGYKAARFNSGPVIDLCCGIGGDLMALAGRGSVSGVDHSPVAAILAAANCRAIGANCNLAAVELDGSATTQPHADVPIPAASACGPDSSGTQKAAAACSAHREVRVKVYAAEVCESMVEGCAAWHIDPDRRPSGRRTTRIALHEPGPDAIDRLISRQLNAAIKLAPAAQLPPHWTEQAELEWISRAGQCRQLVAWFGTLASGNGCRRATIIGKSAGDYRTVSGRGDLAAPVNPAVGRYLFEPDAAVLAAGLCGHLAAQQQLSAVAPGGVYLTGEQPIVDLALSCFEVSELLPYNVKRLKSMLRERRIGRLEVKKRGVPYDPSQVQHQLKVPGDNAATLLLTRVAGSVVAIVAKRIR